MAITPLIMSDSDSPFDVFRRAVGIAGSQAKFAKGVGCTQGNISQLLRNRRELPAQFVLKAEAETGVSRHELRPDLYPRENGAIEGLRP